MADREELRKTVSYKRGSDIFKEKFSNPKNLMNKTAVSPNDYEREFDKWLNEFKNNNGKDFDKWLAGFKKTHVCDDEEFEARCNKELHQIFREYEWVPMLLERIETENELLDKEPHLISKENVWEPMIFARIDAENELL